MNNYLTNIKEEFWHEAFRVNMQCPFCEQYNDMNVSITKKSIRIDCRNTICNKVFFYRRVNLGAVEK